MKQHIHDKVFTTSVDWSPFVAAAGLVGRVKFRLPSHAG
jgi:hypothetical protein